MPSTIGIVASHYSGFTPLELSPSLWLDASDTTTITSSGSPAKVSQWNDKSGNGRNFTQATSANQPTTGATTKNGLNVIDFNGSTWLRSASTTLNNATNGAFTAFAVAKPDSLSAPSKHIICLDNGSSPRHHQLLKFGANYCITVVFNTSGTAFADLSPTMASASWVRSVGITTTTTVEVWQQNTTDGSSAITGTLLTSAIAATVGANGSNGETLAGSIGEIVVVPRAITAAERASLDAYAVAKWAV